MAKFEVNCITQTRPSGRHQDITHLGHRAHRWRLPISTVIYRILTKGERYYLIDQCTGQLFDIGVVHEHGQTYLRAHDNGQWNNRLLELEGCLWPSPSNQNGPKTARKAAMQAGQPVVPRWPPPTKAISHRARKPKLGRPSPLKRPRS